MAILELCERATVTLLFDIHFITNIREANRNPRKFPFPLLAAG